MGMKIEDELLDIEGIKGSNKSLLDLFIRRTAVITSTQEALTEKIIKDQWSRANKAFNSQSSIGEIDFCNIGTLYISPSKARKRILKLKKYNEMIQDTTLTLSEKIEKRKEEVLKENIEKIRLIKLKTKDLENES